MIKVNLLKNRGSVAENTTQMDFEMTVQASDKLGLGTGTSSDSLLKIVILLIPALLLYGYEKYNISQLEEERTSISMRLQSLTSEIDSNKPVVQKAKEMQKEIKELEERIILIKNLSKVRLREIKAIDYLQNVIPDKVWFSELDFKDTNFEAKGFSVSDEALNRFIEGLEGKSFFRNVILRQSVDQKTKTGTIKSFHFSSQLAATD